MATKEVNIRCPECDTIVRLEYGFMHRGKQKCPKCQTLISLKDERMQVAHCPHCENDVVYDALKGAQNVCPVCGKPLTGSAEQSRFREVPCPGCGILTRVVPGSGLHTCIHCGRSFDADAALAHKDAAEAQQAYLIQYSGEPKFVLWKHPLDSFPFKSRLVVREGMSALCLQNGECRYPVGPGSYPLEESPLTREEKFDAAATGESVVFSTEVYFVRNRIPHDFSWGIIAPPTVTSADGATEAVVRASGALSLSISDPKAFAEFVGYATHSLEELTHVAASPSDADAPLIALVRETANDAMGALLPQIVVDRGWDVLSLGRRNLDIAEELRRRMDAELDVRGLKIDRLTIRDLAASETDASIARKARREAADHNAQALLRMVERRVQWTSQPLNVHMKGDATLSATVVFSGSLNLRAEDAPLFLSRSQTAQWVQSGVSAAEVERFLVELIDGQLMNVLYDMAQPMIDESNADIRELSRYFGYLRGAMTEALNRLLASWGLRAENLTLQQKSLVKSPALEKRTAFADYKSEAAVEQEMRAFAQNMEFDRASADAQHRSRLRQVESEDRRDAERHALDDAQSSDEISETLSELQQRALARAERLRRYEADLLADAEDSDVQRDHQRALHALDNDAEIAARKDQIASDVKLRSFDETYAEWQRQSRLEEERLNAELRADEIRQRGRLDAERRDADAHRQEELTDADHRRMMGEILRKIEQSDFDWQQKLDAYERLFRNARAQDDAQNTVTAAKADADAAYAREHLKHVLSSEENDLLEALNRRAEEREERRSKAEFARDMERKEREVAQKMAQLRMEYDHQADADAAQERLAAQAIELEKLKLTLAHYEAMGSQNAETVRAQVEHEYAEKHDAAQREEESRRREDRERREDQYAQRAEDLLKQMWDIQKSLKMMQLENDREYAAGRAQVDQTAAAQPKDDRTEELIQSMRKMAETLGRIERKLKRKEPQPAAQPQPSAERRCPRCGRIVDRFSSYCPGCHTSIL